MSRHSLSQQHQHLDTWIIRHDGSPPTPVVNGSNVSNIGLKDPNFLCHVFWVFCNCTAHTSNAAQLQHSLLLFG